VQGRGEPSGDRIQVQQPAAQGSGDGVRACAPVPLRDGEEPPRERDAARAPAKRRTPPPRTDHILMIPTFTTDDLLLHATTHIMS
jgi:hypothetical protein